MRRVLAVVLAGGAGERLSILSAERAKPAVPFGGRYRIIDFTLSNCANSGIYNIAVLTQFNPRSLAQHIGVGRPWDLDRAAGGIVLLQPFLSQLNRGWYKGTADAVYQNLYYLEDQRADEVLILSGDHIYTMRYDQMIDTHRNRNADVTVAVAEVPKSECSRFGIITLDHNESIVRFEEKPEEAKSNLASMGIYIFNKDVLLKCLDADADNKDSGHDFGKDILPEIIGKHRVFGYRFHGYWRDVGTIESYWRANIDLIIDLPELNLYDPETDVQTIQQNLPPVKLGPKAKAIRSLISNGAIINGCVENSIIFDDTTVRKGAIVDRSIIDKLVWVGSGSCIGCGDDFTANKEEPDYLNTGITIVGKGARIAENIRIGQNCKISCWVESNDFASDFISSGETIVKKSPGRRSI